MTFEWPSWVDPLLFPFPELHNNRYLIMKMLTLSSCPDWSPFSADISVCFFVDGGQIDMKFHPSRGYDRPLLSASPNDNWKTSYRLHQASCIHPAEWIFIYDVSSFTFQTPAMTWPLVTKCHEVCQCHCCMDDDTQTAQLLGVVGVNGLCLSSRICS